MYSYAGYHPDYAPNPCPYAGYGQPIAPARQTYSPPPWMALRQNGSPNGNGNGKQSATDKAKAWWGDRSNVEKGAVVVGGLAVFGLLVLALTGARRYRPNLSSAERSRLQDKKAGESIRVGGRQYKVGKIIDLKSGDRFGHKIPPKDYRNAGARRPSDYAWPDGYKYPLIFRDKSGKIRPEKSRRHVRAAASYFARYGDKYPPKVRRTIARNINKAKKRFGIGGKPAKA